MCIRDRVTFNFPESQSGKAVTPYIVINPQPPHSGRCHTRILNTPESHSGPMLNPPESHSDEGGQASTYTQPTRIPQSLRWAGQPYTQPTRIPQSLRWAERPYTQPTRIPHRGLGE